MSFTPKLNSSHQGPFTRLDYITKTLISSLRICAELTGNAEFVFEDEKNGAYAFRLYNSLKVVNFLSIFLNTEGIHFCPMALGRIFLTSLTSA